MIIPEGAAQANFVYSGTSSPTGAEWTLGINVLNFAGTPEELAEVLITNYLTSAMEDLHVASSTLSKVTVKYGPNETGPSGEAAAGDTGDAGGSGVSPGVAMLVQKVTAAGGRAGRGRLYFPGLSESVVDQSGVLDTTYRSTAQGVFDDFHGKLIADDTPPLLLHAAGSPLSTPTAITAFVVAPQSATQRRRNRR